MAQCSVFVLVKKTQEENTNKTTIERRNVKQQKEDKTAHHLEEFQIYLDDVDIPDDQKHAFLELIWSIMVEFVALGFGADATSQAIAAHLAAGLDDANLTNSFTAANPCKNPKNDCEARP